MTAKQIIKAALQLLGSVEAGADPTSDELADSLVFLNAMLDSWWSEGLTIFAFSREEFTLVAGTASYTIGSGATFDTDRPVEILSAQIQYPGDDVDHPVDIVSQQEYNAVPLKTTQGLPSLLFYNPTYANGTIYLAYTPDQAYTIRLDMLKRLGTISSVASSLTVPEFYQLPIIYNLAVLLGPAYIPAADDVIRIARESKEALINRNAAMQPNDAELDPALTYRMGRGMSRGEFLSGL